MKFFSGSFCVIEFTSFEILKLISSLKTFNSQSTDEISSIVLKNIALEVSDVFAYVFNKCVKGGCLFDNLKMAIATSMYFW